MAKRIVRGFSVLAVLAFSTQAFAAAEIDSTPSSKASAVSVKLVQFDGFKMPGNTGGGSASPSNRPAAKQPASIP